MRLNILSNKINRDSDENMYSISDWKCVPACSVVIKIVYVRCQWLTVDPLGQEGILFFQTKSGKMWVLRKNFGKI